jgi:hypothetical protein
LSLRIPPLQIGHQGIEIQCIAHVDMQALCQQLMNLPEIRPLVRRQPLRLLIPLLQPPPQIRLNEQR